MNFKKILCQAMDQTLLGAKHFTAIFAFVGIGAVFPAMHFQNENKNGNAEAINSTFYNQTA